MRKPPRAAPHTFNDMGNARRLVELCGDDVRHFRGTWYVWDGKRFARDQDYRVQEQAKRVPLEMRKQAYRAISASKELSHDERKAAETSARELLKFADASGNRLRLASMIELARTEPEITVTDADAFDSDPWAFNVQNGTIDLRTGELREHSRGDMITRISPATYDPDARSELFDKFLARIQPDPVERRALQLCVGYTLTGFTGEAKLFTANGGGRNGKNVLLDTVAHLLGDYYRKAPAGFLTARKEDGTSASPDMADMRGARMVMASETERGDRLAESRVKELTGDRTITARFLYGDFFSFRPTFKIWLLTNYRPSVRGTDEGIWSRLALIPFREYITPEERDPHLTDKLIGLFNGDPSDLSGVLTWAVEGARAWASNKTLALPDTWRAAAEDYRVEQDLMGAFLSDHCIFRPGEITTSGDLYAHYVWWCRQAGEHARSQRAFSIELKQRPEYMKNKVLARKSDGRVVFDGMRGLKPNERTHLVAVAAPDESVTGSARGDNEGDDSRPALRAVGELDTRTAVGQNTPVPTQAPSTRNTPAPTQAPSVRRALTPDERPAARTRVMTSSKAALSENRIPSVLHALEGPCAPLRSGREPRWSPERMPGIAFAAIVKNHNWRRPFRGQTITLDRSGAFLAAIASVDVSHGGLEHTGAMDQYPGLPGYYEVPLFPWTESESLPHPIPGIDKAAKTAWITAPHASLLQELVNAGRWPEFDILDSYTGETSVRLNAGGWSDFIKELRQDVINEYGRDSEQYTLQKRGFSRALTLMLGDGEPGKPRKWECRARRPDWTHAVYAHASAMLWRRADECLRLAPKSGPVAVQRVDEIVIPKRARAAVFAEGSKIVHDPLGLKLGSFKVKSDGEE
ncbi:DNA primase family protein [Pseudonocardia dioxanivorans]|nr:phage/plasmid primase, P4 family [Pseudonocardia dioxanivorans]